MSGGIVAIGAGCERCDDTEWGSMASVGTGIILMLIGGGAIWLLVNNTEELSLLTRTVTTVTAGGGTAMGAKAFVAGL